MRVRLALFFPSEKSRFLFAWLTGVSPAAAFHTKSLQIGGVRVDLQIWDTAGQEKFRSLTPMYYRECAAALVVYDLSKPETLETAEYWIKVGALVTLA